MPVFVYHRHLLYNIVDVLVIQFNNAIHLRPVGRRVMMLYLELFTELSDHYVLRNMEGQIVGYNRGTFAPGISLRQYDALDY